MSRLRLLAIGRADAIFGEGSIRREFNASTAASSRKIVFGRTIDVYTAAVFLKGVLPSAKQFFG